MKLTKEQIMRYKKHISLPGIGMEGQLKIKKARVLVVGAGGLGSPLCLYLAGAGVGHLACVDFDQVEIHNLHRQVAHTERTIGMPKVYSLQKQLMQLNSDIVFVPIQQRVSASNIHELIHDYDIVIDGCDNFNTRYIVNDACASEQKPLVYGSVLNYEVQMALFNHEGSKDLRAIFPEPPHPDDVPSCDLNGVLATTPGILALMMAQETLKVLLGLPVLHNQWLIMDTLSWECTKISF
ncbi:HesA/MoeB/ThiF family protein [Sphingobacterium paludis]|jgi:molybdopterin-synthase adenylyltransferase|uniref:Adenylyltransferase/sulfurtransferase n=1 Tax=Sphingobacterium paludis TaxID=1476465 RepID=A0A4R7CTN5_9SPHI|nr:HesA/MoeB/ThiF family protein [Sphingobacterium paludis]TDS11783.1 adenylyltransferase/sulfurtransferase [Sphingobacterium paludis]